MPLLLLTHHVIPWAFKKARQLVRSALAQPQAESCPPNTETDSVANRLTDQRSLNYTTGLECLSENQQNTAEQHTSVISRDNLLNNTCSTHVDTPCDESCEQFHRGPANVTTFLNMAVDGLSKIRGILRILFPLTREDFDYSTKVAVEIGPIGGPLIVITCCFTVICLIFFRFWGNCLFRLKKKVSQALSWVHKKTLGSECLSETQQYSYEEFMFLTGRINSLNNTCSAHVDTPCDESCEQFHSDSEDDIFLERRKHQ